MKMVLNRCFGGFGLSKYAEKKLGHDTNYYDSRRDDEKFIALVTVEPEKASDDCAKLEVINIPDAATDWEFEVFDGMESITYVLNGKIHHLG